LYFANEIATLTFSIGGLQLFLQKSIVDLCIH